jgi:pentatricopeptide repeat domain-containing protein 1
MFFFCPLSLCGSRKRVRLRREIEANVITYSAAISSCEKGEQWQWALLLLNDLLDKRLAGNRITYTSTISACEKGGRWQWALYFMAELHSMMIRCNSIAHYAPR